MTNNKLQTRTLENWLWEAACKIRGEIVDLPKCDTIRTFSTNLQEDMFIPDFEH